MNVSAKRRIDYYLGGILVALLKPIAMLMGLVLRRAHELRPHRSLVVLKFQGGGSLLIAAPAMLGIRAQYPDMRYTLVTTRSLTEFGESVNVFDTIICVDDRDVARLLTSGVAALWKCRGADTVIDLEVYSRLSGIFALLTCARNRIGFYLEATFWRRGIYTHLLFFNRFTGVYFFYNQLAHLLGAQPASREITAEAVASRLSARSRSETTIVAIGPGCSDLAPERRLPVDGWLHFLVPFLDVYPHVDLVFLGGPADRPLAAEIIARLVRSRESVVCVNQCGELSLKESLAILRTAKRYFGIDSALLHFARVFAVPSTSFWGPVMPAQLLTPWEDVEDDCHYTQLPCSPCVHIAETPPCRGNNVCMRCLYDVEFAARRSDWLTKHAPWNGSQ